MTKNITNFAWCNILKRSNTEYSVVTVLHVTMTTTATRQTRLDEEYYGMLRISFPHGGVKMLPFSPQTMDNTATDTIHNGHRTNIQHTQGWR